MWRVAFLLLILVQSDISFAQMTINLKRYDLQQNKSDHVASMSRGKFWIDKEGKRLFLYSGTEVKAFVVSEGVFSEDESLRVGDDEMARNMSQRTTDGKNGTGNELLTFRFQWDLRLPEGRFSALSTDVTGQILFISDQKGFVHVYDINEKKYRGRLSFDTSPVKFIRPLKDGSLLLLCQDGIVLYVKRVKIPLFSMFQSLNSMYTVAAQRKLPYNFVSRVEISPSDDRAVLIVDHKNIVVLALPSLETTGAFQEKLFVEFADFLTDSALLYITMAEKSIADAPFNIHTHLNSMAAFFDWRRFIIPSQRGRFIIRISDRNTFKLYDLFAGRLLSDLGLDYRNVKEIVFSANDSGLIVLNNDRTAAAIYSISK